MVAVGILDTFEYMAFKLLHEGALLVGEDILDSLRGNNEGHKKKE